MGGLARLRSRGRSLGARPPPLSRQRDRARKGVIARHGQRERWAEREKAEDENARQTPFHSPPRRSAARPSTPLRRGSRRRCRCCWRCSCSCCGKCCRFLTPQREEAEGVGGAARVAAARTPPEAGDHVLILCAAEASATCRLCSKSGSRPDDAQACAVPHSGPGERGGPGAAPGPGPAGGLGRGGRQGAWREARLPAAARRGAARKPGAAKVRRPAAGGLARCACGWPGLGWVPAERGQA